MMASRKLVAGTIRSGVLLLSSKAVFRYSTNVLQSLQRHGYFLRSVSSSVHQRRSVSNSPLCYSARDDFEVAAGEGDNFHPRRAVMYVPASDERKTKKASTLNIDTIVLDLEDGVAVNQKVCM